MRRRTFAAGAGTLAGAAVAIVAAMLLLATSTTSCSDSPASPLSRCSDARWNIVGTLQTPRIDFDLPCSSANVTLVDTVNQFGGVIAYDYDIRCSDGSNRHSGRVSDIQYSSNGSPSSATFTHNGESCGTVTTF